MDVKLSEIKAGSKITLLISNEEKQINMDAVIKKNIEDRISVISLCYQSKHMLNFSAVKIKVEYTTEEGLPYIWNMAQIVNFHAEYVLQVKDDGVRNNRRECFRVGISGIGRIRTAGKGEASVMIRDISLSGFAVSDRSNYLRLNAGDEVKLFYSDLGYNLELAGKVVRIEERENVIIYGFRIQNLCKDLSAYLSAKQRLLRASR